MPTIDINQLDPQIAEWYFTLAPAEQQQLLAEAAESATAKGEDAPADWRDWIPALFPKLNKPFGERHAEFYEHIESIQPDIRPPAFFGIWPRDTGKSTSLEVGAIRLGAKEVRKFCLYVRRTQDKANESIQNIAAKLESKTVERYYPGLANRKLGKYGNSKGWRVDTLRCDNGFNIIGLGFDAAFRGVRIEDYRPDIIFLDDIDDVQDSPETINKKITILTKSILPAGSDDLAVVGMQNLIHINSIFNRIAENQVDFLLNRIIKGPYKSVEGLAYELRGKVPNRTYFITAGTATWEGQPIEKCQELINDWGLNSFLQEAQHEVEAPPGGMWDDIEFQQINADEVPEITKGCVWVDPAVTDTDQSDSHGLIADGLGIDGKVYRFYSWERRSSPEDSLKRAILKCLELGFDTVGVETDQGGDLWKSAYNNVWNDLVASQDYPEIDAETVKPKFVAEKAGAGHGSKVHRNSLMLADYQRGNVVHVIGTHNTLEKALRRFPLTKPLDLADAAYWGWYHLKGRWSSMGKFVKV